LGWWPIGIGVSGDCKCSVATVARSGSEVYHHKYSASRSPNVSNAHTDILHGVLVCVDVGIQDSKILHEPDASVFLTHGEDGTVKFAAGSFNDAELKPFDYAFFHDHWCALEILNCLT
jgi:hypothetical protein